MSEYPTEWSREVQQALLAPLALEEEEFLPRGDTEKGQKGTPRRMQGLIYFGAEAVISRLNRVVGPHGWSFSVQVEHSGSSLVMYGTLTVLGHSHSDYGEASGGGELYKAARTDALKRCARNFGIGLYLWFMPKDTWGEHDGYRWTKLPQVATQDRQRALSLAGWDGTLSASPQPTRQAPPAPSPAATPSETSKSIWNAGVRPETHAAPSVTPPVANGSTGATRHEAAVAKGETQPGLLQAPEDDGNTCVHDGCGRFLTKGQKDISRSRFGRSLCPEHQKAATPSGNALTHGL